MGRAEHWGPYTWSGPPLFLVAETACSTYYTALVEIAVVVEVYSSIHFAGVAVEESSWRTFVLKDSATISTAASNHLYSGLHQQTFSHMKRAPELLVVTQTGMLGVNLNLFGAQNWNWD